MRYRSNTPPIACRPSSTRSPPRASLAGPPAEGSSRWGSGSSASRWILALLARLQGGLTTLEMACCLCVCVCVCLPSSRQAFRAESELAPAASGKRSLGQSSWVRNGATVVDHDRIDRVLLCSDAKRPLHNSGWRAAAEKRCGRKESSGLVATRGALKQ